MCMFHSKPNVDLSPNMYFLSQISIHAFFLLFHVNFIYTKNLSQGLFVIYLYTYVYDIIYNISKDTNFKFPKSPKPAFLVRVWEWRGIGTDCPES